MTIRFHSSTLWLIAALASASCLASFPTDWDGDGFSQQDGDCDDMDSQRYPGNTEICDGLDNDCDGQVDGAGAVDVSTWYPDVDEDGYGNESYAVVACDPPAENYVVEAMDCDDGDSGVHPGAREDCNTAYDDDCDGQINEPDAWNVQVWYPDGDGDGFTRNEDPWIACTPPAGYGPMSELEDCDDFDDDTYPGAPELCDGEDNNCNGVGDEEESLSWYFDGDGDTFGAMDSEVSICDPPVDDEDWIYVDNADDCDDEDPQITSWIDWYVDVDGDGYGDSATLLSVCVPPDDGQTYVTLGDDCDDANASTYPEATELCDEQDNDCDGIVDENSSSLWYSDQDGDGYGDADVFTELTDCDPSGSLVADASDCDDTDPLINPGASEYCDGVDNDCDGDTDEADAIDAPTWYRDADLDGFGDLSESVPSCEEPSGFADNADDCDDLDSAVHPGADEFCNDIDDDCDGALDNDAVDSLTWYYDGDSDGHGTADVSSTACLQPANYVSTSDDCDDGDPMTSPNAFEICDGLDNDCDEETDEADAVDASTWYLDSDGDGFGDAAMGERACQQPTDYVDDADDCDDGDPMINPDAAEICDGFDNDCDGEVDENGTTWYRDADADGFGLADDFTYACEQPSGYVDNADDCDDTDPGINPEALEYNDGFDNNCDGDVDYLDLASSHSAFFGEADDDYAGCAVAGIGDFNGDSLDDLLIGASGEDSSASETGAAYLVLGSDTSTAVMSAEVQYLGESLEDRAGSALAPAGDVNDDGFLDLLIGAPDADLGFVDAGVAYLVRGPPLSPIVDLSETIELWGESAGAHAGGALAGGFDSNDDGFADLLIGAYMEDSGGTDSGTVYLLLGPVSSSMDLGSADHIFDGEEPEDWAGRALSSAGDTLGSGGNALLVGATGNDAGGENAGAAYLLVPPWPFVVDLSTAYCTFVGEEPADHAGNALAGVGDVNDDGYDDILIAAANADSDSGVSYLFLNVTSGVVDLSSADARFIGASAGDSAGVSVSAAGDVNDDGFADLIIGSMEAEFMGSRVGAAYLVLGPGAGTTYLSDADAIFYGEHSGASVGSSLANVGNFNADAYQDLVIGASGTSVDGIAGGAAYLVLGAE